VPTPPAPITEPKKPLDMLKTAIHFRNILLKFPEEKRGQILDMVVNALKEDEE